MEGGRFCIGIDTGWLEAGWAAVAMVIRLYSELRVISRYYRNACCVSLLLRSGSLVPADIQGR